MLRRRRHGAAWILTSAFSVSVWSVQLIQLARSYGTLPYPQAPACCLTFLEDLPGESVSWGFGSCSLWREPYRCAFGAVSSLGQRKNWENGGKTMELNIESLTKHYGDLCALGDFYRLSPPRRLWPPGTQRRRKEHPYEPAHRYRQTGGRKHPLQW